MHTRILAILCLLVGVQAQAFDTNGSSWGHLSKPRVVEFAVCDQGLGKEEKDRIAAALNEWSVKDRLLLRIDDSQQCDTNPKIGECLKINVIDRGPLTGLAPEFQTPGGATFRCTDKKKMLGCSIRISDSGAIFTGTGAVPKDKYDLMSVVLHEVGHCIGLAHSTESTAVMFEGIELGKAKRAITSDDKAGRDALYK